MPELQSRASAWSTADQIERFAHIMRLEMALRTATELLENSAFAGAMSQLLPDWRALLKASPGD